MRGELPEPDPASFHEQEVRVDDQSDPLSASMDFNAPGTPQVDFPGFFERKLGGKPDLRPLEFPELTQRDLDTNRSTIYVETMSPAGAPPPPSPGPKIESLESFLVVSNEIPEPDAVHHEIQESNLCAVHALNCLLQRPAFSKDHLDAVCLQLARAAKEMNSQPSAGEGRSPKAYEPDSPGPEAPGGSGLRDEDDTPATPPAESRRDAAFDASHHFRQEEPPAPAPGDPALREEDAAQCSCLWPCAALGWGLSRMTSRVTPNPHRSPIGSGNYDVNVMMLALQSEGYELRWYDKRNLPSEKFLKLEAVHGLLLNVVLEIPWYKRLFKPCVSEAVICARHWIALRQVGPHFFNLDSLARGPRTFASPSSVHEYLDRMLRREGTEVLTMHRVEQSGLGASATFISPPSAVIAAP